jgi:alkyl hydroperoxide reductase subunit F
MKDLIIVGAGPAGITAAVYAARKKMDFLVISKDLGGQTVWSADIDNYTGYQFITGVELTQKFREHLEQFEVGLNEGEAATLVEKQGDVIQVESDKATYEAKTVIVASGRIPRQLNVEGERELRNRGVTYCATCDGPLFAGKPVAVIGGGNSAFDAALQLMNIAKEVLVFERSADLRADPIMIEKARANPKVRIFTQTAVRKIEGDNFVNAIHVVVEDEPRRFDVEGIFIEIGSHPSSDFVKGVEKNEFGEIIVDCESKTDVPGLFAAGDVTNVYAKQIIIACGEGAKATLAAFEYLSRHK